RAAAAAQRAARAVYLDLFVAGLRRSSRTMIAQGSSPRAEGGAMSPGRSDELAGETPMRSAAGMLSELNCPEDWTGSMVGWDGALSEQVVFAAAEEGSPTTDAR